MQDFLTLIDRMGSHVTKAKVISADVQVKTAVEAVKKGVSWALSRFDAGDYSALVGREARGNSALGLYGGLDR